VVGAYYYVRIVKVMFFDEPKARFLDVPSKVGVVMALSACFVLLYVIWPAPLVNAADAAAKKSVLSEGDRNDPCSRSDIRSEARWRTLHAALSR